jgi:hypothetical protein
VLGRHFSPRLGTVGLAQSALAMRTVARWCGRRGFVGGLGVARPVETPWGSDDGCTGQVGATGFSPETAGGGGAEKMARRDGGLPVAGGGRR